LKTICALANAQGGVIEIGRDENGVIVGIHDAGKLLEDLPNKIRNAMGVIADVDLQETDVRRYISITVKPYPYPLNYRGKYYYRSGSMTQELSGSGLDEFMLRKQGKTWDSVPVPYVRFSDFAVPQLASQKWGVVQVRSAKEYIRLCVGA
jgi:ATP-dependent DNA helicase RecG